MSLKTEQSQTAAHKHELANKIFGSNQPISHRPILSRPSSSGRRGHPPGESSPTAQMHTASKKGDGESRSSELRTGPTLKSGGGTAKLGTFSGVFVPTTLNVLSILMFLRFGFILGQSGVVGMMGKSHAVKFPVWTLTGLLRLGMLIVAYIINLVTTLSISAIATNGTVRSGGAYYLISRSLGPEFGGSIGIVLYLGFVFNTGMNAVGLVHCFKANFGERSGNWAHWLPQGFWVEYAWATIILVICTGICLAGSSIFARCSTGLLAILLAATFSIPFSAIVLKPSRDRGYGIDYTGLSVKTFMGNVSPKFTQGADGSHVPGMENFQDLFGILFPATGGIFA